MLTAIGLLRFTSQVLEHSFALLNQMARRIDEVGGYCIPPNTLITSFRALDEGSFLGSFYPHLGSDGL